MKKHLIIASIVLLLLAGGYYYLAADSVRAAAEQPQIQTRSSATAQSTDTANMLAQSQNHSALATAGQTPASSHVLQAALRAQNEIRLERRLPDYRSFNMDGRNWAVLGSKSADGLAGAKQTVLVLRDEVSGQLAYRQAALRFVLREGQDYESFIRERGKARRQFVNSLYGEIAVDLADITDEYVALANDQRVRRLEFIPLAVPVKAK